jgi:hypothetical protein
VYGRVTDWATGDPGCEGEDLDKDGDVDQSDYGLFQRCISGEDEPATPGCPD